MSMTAAIIQLAAVALFLLLVTTQFLGIKLRLLTAALSAGLITAEMASWFIKGHFIDYRFFQHLTLNTILSYKNLFLPQLFGGPLFFVAGFFFFYFLGKKLTGRHYRKLLLLPIIGVTVIILCQPHGIFNEFYPFGRSLKKNNNSEVNVNTYRQDIKRFIAHAGGMIEKHTYTNSLEALDLNYRKGFRLFELDIIKTADEVYVAAHDWETWVQRTGYQGKLPPDRDTFKQHKIYKKYTPLDMIDINHWFAAHPDAILITDKINTPADFASRFIDRKRLMMELFSWEAVHEGLKVGIKSAMPTGGILWRIKGDKASYMKELGITDIAMSRRALDRQRELIRNLATAGLHIYAFNLNCDPGIDERYVVCHERQYFYGMYADKWDFNTPIDCNQRKVK